MFVYAGVYSCNPGHGTHACVNPVHGNMCVCFKHVHGNGCVYVTANMYMRTCVLVTERCVSVSVPLSVCTAEQVRCNDWEL